MGGYCTLCTTAVSNLELQQVMSDTDIHRDVRLLKQTSPSMQLAAKASELVAVLRPECAKQERTRAKALIDKWNAAGDRKKLREAVARHAAITQMLSDGKLQKLSSAAFTKVVNAVNTIAHTRA
jgi:hypothetical protein